MIPHLFKADKTVMENFNKILITEAFIVNINKANNGL